MLLPCRASPLALPRLPCPACPAPPALPRLPCTHNPLPHWLPPCRRKQSVSSLRMRTHTPGSCSTLTSNGTRWGPASLKCDQVGPSLPRAHDPPCLCRCRLSSCGGGQALAAVGAGAARRRTEQLCHRGDIPSLPPPLPLRLSLQVQTEQLYCVALCHRSDIPSLRSLRAEHLPLLDNMRRKSCEVGRAAGWGPAQRWWQVVRCEQGCRVARCTSAKAAASQVDLQHGVQVTAARAAASATACAPAAHPPAASAHPAGACRWCSSATACHPASCACLCTTSPATTTSTFMWPTSATRRPAAWRGKRCCWMRSLVSPCFFSFLHLLTPQHCSHRSTACTHNSSASASAVPQPEQ